MVRSIRDDFYNWEDLINGIWEDLDKGNLLLVAPYRFGKSSIMLHMRDNPIKEYNPIYVDLEGINSPTDFFAEIMSKTIQNLPGFLQTVLNIKVLPKGLFGILERVKIGVNISSDGIGGEIGLRDEIADSIGKDWRVTGTALLKIVMKYPNKVLYLLDEFTRMIKLMLKTDSDKSIPTFISWFRAFCNEVYEKNIRLIIGSPVGIISLMKSLDSLESVNHIKQIGITPYSPEDAFKYVYKLFCAKKVNVNNGIIQRVLDEVDLFPFFLDLLVDEICKLARSKKIDITPDLVSNAYTNMLIDTHKSIHFKLFLSVIEEFYGSNRGYARVILKELIRNDKLNKTQIRDICLKSEASISDEDLCSLIMDLESDYYLERVENNKY